MVNLSIKEQLIILQERLNSVYTYISCCKLLHVECISIFYCRPYRIKGSGGIGYCTRAHGCV